MKINSLSHLPIGFLRTLFSIDPAGVLRHEFNTANTIRVGKAAGSLRKKDGRRLVRILGDEYIAARVAWAIHHGEHPPEDRLVDHINGKRSDDRKENLRLATPSQNCQNRVALAGKVKGVYFSKRLGKYQAQIKLDGRTIHLGIFDAEDKARAAYGEASSKYHGEFGRVA